MYSEPGSKEITRYEDIINSCDIIERIKYLTEYLGNDPDDIILGDEIQELNILRGIQDDIQGYDEDWVYVVTLIRDSYFEEYAQQLAEEIGAIPENLSWPASCIDWGQAAIELQQDYTSVDFDGVTYWAR